jgi:phage RecT family recombinase
MNTEPLSTAVAKSTVHPVERLRAQLDQRAEELRRALPAHVRVERFTRVVLTACAVNPDLYAVNRGSLLLACIKAAHDGLLPDGRDGVILPYKDNNPRSPTCGQMVAQWQPMVGGLIKRFRNSGQFRSISAGVVREGEPFEYWIDENGEHLRHTPGDEGKPIKAYAIAKTKNGGIFIRVMSKAEIDKRRAVSKAKDGPMWREWWDEAAMKTVLRNLSKRLPSSSDLDELVRRDDEEEAFSTRVGHSPDLAPSEVAAVPENEDEDIHLDREAARQRDDAAPDQEESLAGAQPRDDLPVNDGQSDVDRAFAEGAEARRTGHARRAVPGPYREPQASHLARSWWAGWDSAEQRS